MATFLLWITSALLATSMLGHQNCGAVAFNKNSEVQPQKMVEIIQLMLSKTPNNSDNREFGIQKVPQEDSPSYEILITPNKNLKELKESQKIKIFVEAGNFDNEEKTLDSKTDVQVEKQNAFGVLPLSIETIGLNIQDYKHSMHAVKFNTQNEEFSQKDSYSESYPSKRQTTWGFTSNMGNSNVRIEPSHGNRQAEIKEIVIQREPSYVDQNNPYGPVSEPKKEERQRTSIYDGDYSSSTQNGKRVKQHSFVDGYSNPVEEPVRTRPTSKDYKRNYDGTFLESSVYEEVRPANERRPSVRETEIRPRPTYVRETDELRPSESRGPVYGRESEERRPNYEREEIRPKTVYVANPEEVRPTSERRPVYEETRPSDSRSPVYVREPEESSRDRRPTYDVDSSAGGGYKERPTTSSGGHSNKEHDTGYSGFPESYQAHMNNLYSRPLLYEPTRAFPASPCHNVFKYEGREPEEDRWYADIYVSTDEALTGMRLDITLDKPAELLTNWFAEVKSKDSTHFTILSLTHKLVPGPTETVKIMVKFNAKKPVPFVKSIHLNGRIICPLNRAQKTTTRKPVYEYPGDLELSRSTTERYKEVKRPISFNGDYETGTKKTERRTTPSYDKPKRTTRRPNPNGYDETDQNSFNPPPKKLPGRPAHSNGKPPPHAAKPAQGQSGNKPGNGPPGHASGNKPGQGQGNKKPPQYPSSPEKLSSINSGEEVSQKTISCGIPSVQPRPLITHGESTARGQWPWHVALYKNVGTDLTFFCGGSLINHNYVLTAAHCVVKTYTTKPVDESILVVYLGKYHLQLWSEGGVQNRQVSKIYIHPKYNSSDYQSDIAVLALSSPVEYTDYIRPICLWDRSNTRIEDLKGKIGTVVGWGFDENKKLTEELRQAKMPIVEQETCLWSYPDFYPQFTSNMTFCAGFQNGTSVCNGDSGGGMVFPYKDRNGVERWHIRGIVSISPARNDSRICDPSYYVVFTDVAKYLTWLDNFL